MASDAELLAGSRETWWKISRYSSEPEPVEVVKESKTRVWFVEGRHVRYQDKITEWHRYFRTERECCEHMLAVAQGKLDSAEMEIKEQTARIAALRDRLKELDG